MLKKIPIVALMTSIVMSLALTVSALEITKNPAYAASEICSTLAPSDDRDPTSTSFVCQNKKTGELSSQQCFLTGTVCSSLHESTLPKDDSKLVYKSLKEQCKNPDPNQSCEKSNP
jgi:hypothetical protein